MTNFRDCAACGEHPVIKDVKDYDYDSFTGVSCLVGDSDFDGLQITWKRMIDEFNAEKDFIVDCRSHGQHSLINFTEKSDQKISHLPLKQMYKMSKEQIEGALGMETEQADDSKGILFANN